MVRRFDSFQIGIFWFLWGAFFPAALLCFLAFELCLLRLSRFASRVRGGLLCAPTVSFSARRATTLSAPYCHEFTIVECCDPLLEPCSGDVDALLLNIRVKCSCLRAKVAHISRAFTRHVSRETSTTSGGAGTPLSPDDAPGRAPQTCRRMAA